MVMRIRSRKAAEEPLPETRFDRWPSEDVYTALETQMGEVTHLLDSYRRCDDQQKESVLESCDVKLRTALQAVQTLRADVLQTINDSDRFAACLTTTRTTTGVRHLRPLHHRATQGPTHDEVTIRRHEAKTVQDAETLIEGLRDTANQRDGVSWQFEEIDAEGNLYGLAPGGVVYLITVVPPLSVALAREPGGQGRGPGGTGRRPGGRAARSQGAADPRRPRRASAVSTQRVTPPPAPTPSLYRRRKGCLGVACAQAATEYYDQYRADHAVAPPKRRR